MLLNNDLDAFNFMELESVKYIRDCQSEGIYLPQLIIEMGNNLIKSNVSVLDAGKAKEVSVPQEGVLQTFVRYSETHIRELRFLSDKATIMKTTTPFKDG